MSKGGFLLIAAVVIGLVAAFALGILDWGYWRSWTQSHVANASAQLPTGGGSFNPATARSQAETCRANLKRIESAKRQAASAAGVTKSAVSWNEVLPYLSGKRKPVCPAGGSYIIGSNEVLCKCTVSNNRTTDNGDDHIIGSF